MVTREPRAGSTKTGQHGLGPSPLTRRRRCQPKDRTDIRYAAEVRRAIEISLEVHRNPSPGVGGIRGASQQLDVMEFAGECRTGAKNTEIMTLCAQIRGARETGADQQTQSISAPL